MTAKGMTVDQAYVRRVTPRKMHYNLAYLHILISSGDIKVMFQTVFEVFKISIAILEAIKGVTMTSIIFHFHHPILPKQKLLK